MKLIYDPREPRDGIRDKRPWRLDCGFDYDAWNGWDVIVCNCRRFRTEQQGLNWIERRKNG